MMSFLSLQQLFQNFPTDLLLKSFCNSPPSVVLSSPELWQKDKVPTLTGFAVRNHLLWPCMQSKEIYSNSIPEVKIY